jgi:mannan endo-1,4-beta-mannosidase
MILHGVFAGSERLQWFALALWILGIACIRKPPGANHASVDSTRERLAAAQAGQKPSDTHMYVVGRHLHDRCGERVLLRGINHMVIWTDREGATFPEIAKTGANTLRIVWTVKDHPGEDVLDAALTKSLAARLIPIIELHDATGKLNVVPELVDFWVRPEIVAVLKKHEASLILNVANEAGGNGTRTDAFVEIYRSAIQRLRAAGLEMPIMIDAPGWGQDINVLQDAAPALLAADPQKNLLFSVHMWWVQGAGSADPGSKQRIVSELEESVAMELPLVIGEFAHAGVGCAKFIDYETIISEAQKHEVGWLAWSWGPGNNDCAEMDMTTDGRFETLRDWGLRVAVEHPVSIKNTSRIPESVYRGECARRIEAEPAAPSN